MKKYYPNTETYLICFDGGASGNFIATLCAGFIEGIEDKKIFESGHAHNLLQKHNFTYQSLLYLVSTGLYGVYPSYELLELHDPRATTFILDHAKPNFTNFFEIYPLGKIIIVVVEDDDELIIKGNLYFKVIKNLFNKKQLSIAETMLKEKIEKIIDKTFNYPIDKKNFTDKEVLQLLQSKNLYKPVFIDFTIPHDLENKVFKIYYKDIYRNKEKILGYLSKITNRNCNSSIELFYDRYIENQKRILENNMPWANSLLKLDTV